MAVQMDQRLEATTENNRKYFIEYEKYLKEVRKSTEKTIQQYLNAVLLFLDHIGKKEVNEIVIQDVENFLLRFNNSSTSNMKIYALKGYLSIAQEKNGLKFNLDELNEFLNNTKLVNSDKQNTPKALTIEEIVQLRASLERNQDYKRWFSFEMAYQYGFSLSELSKCTLKTWDSLTNTFTFKKDVVIDGNALYLIRHHNVLPNIKIATATHQGRISELARYLDRDIKYSDLPKTRERTFFNCPRCNGVYECSPQNWAIFEYSLDQSKWLVCKSCAGEKYE